MTNVYLENPIEIENAGLFISAGQGLHPDRVLNSFELILVVSGELSLEEDQKQYELKAGEAIVLHPHLRHRGTANYSKDLTFYWVHFRLSKYSKLSFSNTWMELPKHVELPETDTLTSLFTMLILEQENNNNKQTMSLLLLLIIDYLSKKTVDKINSNGKTMAQNAYKLIRLHHREPLSSSILARKLKCNVDYLGRVFKTHYNLSITEAINLKKVQTAKNELVIDYKLIKDISSNLGFKDERYFRRVFYKYVGMTPSEYKKKYSISTVNSE